MEVDIEVMNHRLVNRIAQGNHYFILFQLCFLPVSKQILFCCRVTFFKEINEFRERYFNSSNV